MYQYKYNFLNTLCRSCPFSCVDTIYVQFLFTTNQFRCLGPSLHPTTSFCCSFFTLSNLAFILFHLHSLLTTVNLVGTSQFWPLRPPPIATSNCFSNQFILLVRFIVVHYYDLSIPSFQFGLFKLLNVWYLFFSSTHFHVLSTHFCVYFFSFVFSLTFRISTLCSLWSFLISFCSFFNSCTSTDNFF